MKYRSVADKLQLDLRINNREEPMKELKTITCTLRTLFGDDVNLIEQEESYIKRVLDLDLSFDVFDRLSNYVKTLGVTRQFIDVIDTFKVSENETPAGFRLGYQLEANGVLRVDLIRDIGYEKNGKKRPTKVLFSADTANPYEIKPIAKMVANLTCNPGIIYDLFINNKEVNIGNHFKNRDEVMAEIGQILGPGADISVELNDPFRKSDTELIEEAEKFREMLSKYRVVIKVPHMGPVTSQNVEELLSGNKKLSRGYKEVTTAGALRAHNLALLLHENGFRVNFTLMFEPYQTALAMQAKPYFINSFIRHRAIQSDRLNQCLKKFEVTGDTDELEKIRNILIEQDYLTNTEEVSLLQLKTMTENLIRYRHFNDAEGADGLDAVRHNLRVLKNSNLDDSRLIICSMEGEFNYPDIDKLLVEKEFEDLVHRVIITAEPRYLARFTSTNQVISYQRRFLNAAHGKN